MFFILCVFYAEQEYVSWCLPQSPHFRERKLSSVGLNGTNDFYFSIRTNTHFVVPSVPPQWQLNNSSCLFGLCSSGQSHLNCLRVAVSLPLPLKWSNRVIESSSKASSPLSVICGGLFRKLPHSHCSCQLLHCHWGVSICQPMPQHLHPITFPGVNHSC